MIQIKYKDHQRRSIMDILRGNTISRPTRRSTRVREMRSSDYADTDSPLDFVEEDQEQDETSESDEFEDAESDDEDDREYDEAEETEEKAAEELAEGEAEEETEAASAETLALIDGLYELEGPNDEIDPRPHARKRRREEAKSPRPPTAPAVSSSNRPPDSHSELLAQISRIKAICARESAALASKAELDVRIAKRKRSVFR